MASLGAQGSGLLAAVSVGAIRGRMQSGQEMTGFAVTMRTMTNPHDHHHAGRDHRTPATPWSPPTPTRLGPCVPARRRGDHRRAAGPARPPHPCDQYDVRALLDHVRLVAGRVENIGRGLDPMAVDETAFRGLDHGADWAAVGAAIDAGWADDAVLASTVVLPWATLPGAGALAMYVSELLTHTWDLAEATGQRPGYPEAIAETSLALMQQALTADMRTDEVPFGSVVDTAADAPAIERLVAWTGRDPRWAARA
ncbi:MAG: TIGR03086 family metal-binding protein [Acidimicrobiales bacterium]